MGDSKKSAPKVRDVSPPDWVGLAQPIQATLAQHAPTGAIAVACSGGPDSAALAVVCAPLCQALSRPLLICHVHHGMQSAADQWSDHVQQLGDLLGVQVVSRQVHVDGSSGLGPEASARRARYEALAEMAHTHQVKAVLLAHHAQDQAETLLLRLVRGTGLTGVAGMQAVTHAHEMMFLRPWLTVSKSDITQSLDVYRQQHAWQPVEDPSNVDQRLGRGALRAQVIPALAARWPSWVENMTRFAQQAQQANALLNDYADRLLGEVLFDVKPHGFDLLAWRQLDAAQQGLVLRRWLALGQAPMPTASRLDELMRQLRGLHALGQDRHLSWHHGSFEVNCLQKRVILSSR